MDFVVTEIDADRAVVACSGRLNTVSAGAFRETVAAAIDGGRTTVVVDLADVAFIDSSGLGALVGCLKSARRAGGDLRIATWSGTAGTSGSPPSRTRWRWSSGSRTSTGSWCRTPPWTPHSRSEPLPALRGQGMPPPVVAVASSPLMTLAHDPRIRFEASGTDLGRAIEEYTEAYRGTGFAATRTSLYFSHRHTAAGTRDFTLRGTRFGARMSGEVDMTDGYFVSWVTEGDAVIDVGRDETVLRPGIPVPFPTGRPHAFDFADVVQNLVHFDAAYLERVAGELHGCGPAAIAFDHAATPDPARLAAWRAAVSEAAQVVLRDRGATDGTLALAARRLATALLRTFPHELHPTTGRVDPAARQDTAHVGTSGIAPGGPIVLVDEPSIAFPAGAGERVRAAITHMHEHAHEPISSTDVATAVGLSVRGLQQAFQRQVGESPNAHLRAVRLDRVRAELQASPPGTTVAGVARHWGFAHLGRFAAAYTERFGEYPRDTLLG